MAIHYRMIDKADNINDEKDKKKGLYPRIINKETIETKALTKKVSHKINLNEYMVKLLIESLIDTMEEELKNGNFVCINGFGTFSLSAKSKNVLVENEIRAESISVKKMGFRCSPLFLKRLKFAKFKRVSKE